MSYAHVTNGTVDAEGLPPPTMLVDGRWWDLRTLDPVALAACGWYPVIATERPAGTSGITSDRTLVYAAGVVTETWTERPKTPAEIDAAIRAANGVTLTDVSAARAALTANGAFLALGAPTNAQSLAQIRALTRHDNRIIRHLLGAINPVLLDSIPDI